MEVTINVFVNWLEHIFDHDTAASFWQLIIVHISYQITFRGVGAGGIEALEFAQSFVTGALIFKSTPGKFGSFVDPILSVRELASPLDNSMAQKLTTVVFESAAGTAPGVAVATVRPDSVLFLVIREGIGIKLITVSFQNGFLILGLI